MVPGRDRDRLALSSVVLLLTPPPRGRPSNLALGLECWRKEDWSGLPIGRWARRKNRRGRRGLQAMNPLSPSMTRGQRVLGKKLSGKLFWEFRSPFGTDLGRSRRKMPEGMTILWMPRKAGLLTSGTRPVPAGGSHSRKHTSEQYPGGRRISASLGHWTSTANAFGCSSSPLSAGRTSRPTGGGSGKNGRDREGQRMIRLLPRVPRTHVALTHSRDSFS